MYDHSYINSYLNGSYYDLLNDNAKKMILKGRWNIGSVNTKNFNNAYGSEKLKEYYTNIGLINYSDYLALGNNSWLNSEDDILLLNKTMDDVNIIHDGIDTRSSLALFNYLPCVYLKPDISILSGDGTIGNPYELGVKYQNEEEYTNEEAGKVIKQSIEKYTKANKNQTIIITLGKEKQAINNIEEDDSVVE